MQAVGLRQAVENGSAVSPSEGLIVPPLATLAPQRRLVVRIADGPRDIEAAQQLRWQVFYKEGGAIADGNSGIDVDRYDAVCDHLLVEDHGCGSGEPVVVGTYRLLRESVARRHGGFYSAGEYDLAPLAALNGELLELGRSCVAAPYRDSRTIQLLWRGIADYLNRHDISMMFGCASLPGIDTAAHAETLGYLWRHHLAPPHLRVRALPDRFVSMNLGSETLDRASMMQALPPLIKGYLRVGAMLGDGAVIDHQFNTVDVFVMMPVEGIARRYRDRFQAVGG